MARVLVIHYDPAEAQTLADRIRREDFDVEVYPCRGFAGFRQIGAAPPDAIVIDLSRMPSYGRAMGALLRERKSTRGIPLVFIAGDPAKTRLVRGVLPDAAFSSVLRIGPALRKAISEAPVEPAAPNPSGVPLAAKLGVGEGSAVALIHPPEGFLEKLGALPKDVHFERHPKDAEIVLLFVKSAAALGRELPSLAREIRRGQTLWVIWPKKSSGVISNLTMGKIVEMCIAVGLSGYKPCAVDETWSGLAVAPARKSNRTGKKE
jgi:hypothetical protein